MPSAEGKKAYDAVHYVALKAKVDGVDASFATVITRALSDISRDKLKLVDEVRVRLANAQHDMATTIADAEKDSGEVLAAAREMLDVATTANRALKDLSSFDDAQKVLVDARATLVRLREEREAIRKKELLDGGLRRTPRGKKVHKSGADIKKVADDRSARRRAGRTGTGTGQTHFADKYDSVSKVSHAKRKGRDRWLGTVLKKKVDRGFVEEDEPLELNVRRKLRGPRGRRKVLYYVEPRMRPPGCTESNEPTTLAKANALSRRWQKELRAAGLWTSKKERQKTGRPTGVRQRGDKWEAQLKKKAKMVILRAPDGSNRFGTMEAAGDAIEAWKAAGKPEKGSLVYKVY